MSKVRDVISIVEMEMRTDVDASHRDNVRINANYDTASKEVKAVLDDVFISLCGYSLDTILHGKQYEDMISEE